MTSNRSNCLAMADTAKLSSGLHVHAAPFVPGTNSKADVKSSPAPAPPKAAANGSAANTKGPAAPVQTPDKAAEDKPTPAPGSSSNKGSGGGTKGGKGGGKQGPNAPGSASKLAAAASAAPFVPGVPKPGVLAYIHTVVALLQLSAATVATWVSALCAAVSPTRLAC